MGRRRLSVFLSERHTPSGFSSIFPEGEMIGFVESVNKETANFLTIKVKLATDFKRISDVYIIANTRKEEQQALGRENHE